MFLVGSSRRTWCRTVLAAVLGSLVLCGAAAAASTDPQVQIAPADQSWAESIVLRAGDLGPGWKGSAAAESEPGAGTGAGCPELGTDESDLTITGGNSSPEFLRTTGAGGLVSSTAFTWQTAEQAQADWDRNVQPALLTCLARSVQSASTKGLKIVVTAKRQLTYPAVAPRTAAYGLSLLYKTTVKIKKKRKKIAVPATLDFVALGNGRATAILLVISFNRAALSETYKQSLATVMALRMASDPNTTP